MGTADYSLRDQINLMKNSAKDGIEDHKQFLWRSRHLTEMMRSLDQEEFHKLIFLTGLPEDETEFCLNTNVISLEALVDILCDLSTDLQSQENYREEDSLEDSRTGKTYFF